MEVHDRSRGPERFKVIGGLQGEVQGDEGHYPVNMKSKCITLAQSWYKGSESELWVCISPTLVIWFSQSKCKACIASYNSVRAEQ